jgi:hypothetical protein
METPCHSSTADLAPREQSIGVYRVDFRTSSGISIGVIKKMSGT